MFPRLGIHGAEKRSSLLTPPPPPPPQVLNQAREALPTEPAIWITAAKLEESQACAPETIEMIVGKAVESMRAHQVAIDRDAWLKEAEAAEEAGAPHTCGAIVRHVIGVNVEEEDRRRTWLDDAEGCAVRGAVEASRAILGHALTTFPSVASIWLRAAQLEKKHGSISMLDAILEKSVTYCPQAEILWLMRAKEKWLSGDVPTARQILTEAFSANPDSEQMWLAAVKLEWENDEPERARILLGKARTRASSPRVWMKSALLELEQAATGEALAILDGAIKKYPIFVKFYMMAGQACAADPSKAAGYVTGLRCCCCCCCCYCCCC